MSCPTCDHTMTGFGCKVTDKTFFWCPRCGTIKPCEDAATAPALVERCREFCETLKGECAMHAHAWKQVGIAEAIDPPRSRVP